MKFSSNSVSPASARVRTLLAVGCALCFVATTTVVGAQEDDKKDVAVKEYKRDKEPERKKIEQSGPGFKTSAAKREFKAEAQRKRDEAIKLLRELIESTDDSDEEKPEFLFQLSELLWAKSKYYEATAFKTQDQMYAAHDRKDRAEADRLKGRMQSELQESKRLREEAVKVYVQIIRNYQNYKNLDNVYFYLGVNLLEIGKQVQALTIFKELIKKYPDSPYIPNVLLAFGEYYFDNDDMDQAMKAYNKVIGFKKSNVRTYAMYKLAWCYYNLTEYDRALQQFNEVVKIAGKGGSKSDKSLRKEALKDIVLTYSHIGRASKAMPFFKKLVKHDSDVYFMGERLAQIYQDSGQFQQSTEMYRKLIAANKGSARIVGYQLEVVRNTEALGIKIETVREVLRTLKLLPIARGYKDASPEYMKEVETKLEQILREYATNFHREAQKTKQENTYALAYEMYKAYLETFPNSADKYVMTFFYAELLYRVKKYAEAAVKYDEVVAMNPKGQYSKEAVYAAVLSYQKMAEAEFENEKKKRKNNKAEYDNIPVGDEVTEAEKNYKPPAKKEIPELKKKLIAACDRYVENNPTGESVIKVMFSAAYTYYDHNHFDEAIPRFEKIVKTDPNHEISTIAADLHLDSLYIKRDYAGLEQAAYFYLDVPALAKGEFESRLRTIAEKSTFKKCNQLETAQKWEEAAKCFTRDFYQKFPDSEMLDKALYNAALDYERIKELGKAIQVRKGLLQLRPDSDLVPTTLFNIGGNYHAIAVYSEASKFYELFVQHFPKHEKAETALGNAATFRQGLGQYDKAIENYEKYLQLFPQKKEKCAEVYFQIGKIYETEGKKKAAIEHYAKYLKKWARVGRTDRQLEAMMKIAMFDWDARRYRDAEKGFARTLKVYNGLRDKQRAELSTGADAAAQARFMQGEVAFKELRKIKLKLPEKLLQKRLIEKIKGYEKAKVVYFDVFKFGRPDWTLAALYRIGSLFQDFANEIRNSPIPAGMTYDQKEIYKGGLEEKASGIEGGAIEAYEKCLGTALEKSWFNQYSKKSEIALAGLKPRDYRKPSELRATPNHDAAGFTTVDFLDKAVKDEALGLPEAGEQASRE